SLNLHSDSFPTRRSSDLQTKQQLDCENAKVLVVLTMSDLFLNKSFKSEEKLQKLLTQNTLTRKHNLKLTMHENGYNMDEHKKRRSEEHTSELQSRFDLVC